MMRKRKMTSGRSQNPFIVIALYQESNCTCRTKNHFLLRWSTSTLPERLTHPLMNGWKVYWRLLERGWRKITIRCMDRLHKIHLIERKATWWVHMVRGGDSQENKQPLVQTMYGQICGRICLMQRKRKQNKDGLSRNQSSTMPDNWEEYSVLNQTMKNSSSEWKPLGEGWKFRCQQQCLAKYR